jgi:hypothetical protein
VVSLENAPDRVLQEEISSFVILLQDLRSSGHVLSTIATPAEPSLNHGTAGEEVAEEDLVSMLPRVTNVEDVACGLR